MKIDTNILIPKLSDITAAAQAAEAIGFDTLWVSETLHDPFLPLTLAAEHSQNLNIGTNIAVAFPRSPGTLAYTAWDLACYSKGRFKLGLGTQIKAHNERRFGVKWEQPVAKMREVILALRAFWDCWQNGTKLNFRGEFFKLTLMAPFFNPGPHDYPHIPIYLAGINKNMVALAGELCEGYMVHPFHTVRYLEDFALPHLDEGLQKGDRQRSDITLSSAAFVVPTDDPNKIPEYERIARQQIAFYASTPGYSIVLDLHGWGEIGTELGQLAARQKWTEMPDLVTDEMMAEFVVRGTWAELPGKIKAKYNGGELLDRVSYYLPFVPSEMDEVWRTTVAGFRS